MALLLLLREAMGCAWTYPATDRGWYCAWRVSPRATDRREAPTERAAIEAALVACAERL
jgi:hypothetical protein